MNLTRANKIIDNLSEVLVAQSYTASLYSSCIPFSKVGITTRLEIAHALYLTTAQVFQEAINGRKVTSAGDGSFEAYFRGTSGTLANVLWLTPCLPDEELEAISRMDSSSNEFFVESARLSAILDQDPLKQELETMDSFVSFIRTLDRRDLQYWRNVYQRIGLEPESNLMQEWLQDRCWHCGLGAGDKHTLYKKTAGVRAREASFAELRIKSDPTYRPDREETSDYFWHCKQCARALGPDYQGDPDDDGNCSNCATSLRAWEEHKRITIQAAGGIDAWERKKRLNKILLPFDYVFVTAGGISALILVLNILFTGVVGLCVKLSDTWSTSAGKVFLILAVVSLGWCAIRWKALNETPKGF